MRLLLLTLIMMSYTSNLQAETLKPKWEMGVAFAAASIPQYMGSNERYQLALPLPYLIYRGDRFRVNGRGIRTTIFDNPTLSLDASFGAGLPIRNNNQARQGMPSLPFTLQMGPRINWQLQKDAQHDLRVRLPLRWAVDTSFHHVGWLLEPELLWQYEQNKAWSYRLSGSALFASQSYQSRFYSVAPIYATATRPAYQAQAGLHSVALRASAYYQASDALSFFAAVRYRNLQAGVVANSPLVKNPHDVAIFIGGSYRLWQSDEQVPDDLDD